MPYLIDGHNLIPKIPGMSLTRLNDEDELIVMLQTYCRVKRQAVEVFFDGAPAGRAGVEKKGALIVHYVTVGSKADYAIHARLIKLGKAAKNWRVVTSDRQVQAEARARGAEVIKSELFAVELGRAALEAQEKARQSGELEVGSVDEWLREFGEDVK